MSAGSPSKESILDAISGSGDKFRDFLGSFKADEELEQLADGVADFIVSLNSGEIDAGPGEVQRLLGLASTVRSERLRTVLIGTLWREDLPWLELRIDGEITAREKLLRIAAGDKPKALAAVFWRAVAERGPRFAAVAFQAAEKTHPHEAARLLVSLCRASISGRYDMEIRKGVDDFLAERDSSVRTTFLIEVKRMPEAEKRKLMNHLDMSLMAELDRDAIDQRGKSFFYDEDAERRKREEKGKDIFEEVRRRLERGEKPQL